MINTYRTLELTCMSKLYFTSSCTVIIHVVLHRSIDEHKVMRLPHSGKKIKVHGWI